MKEKVDQRQKEMEEPQAGRESDEGRAGRQVLLDRSRCARWQPAAAEPGWWATTCNGSGDKSIT